ncbi:eCIS core domain-containing protein [Streptomyces hirsutus]|uniref:eCIS core domain-containing protein n=1 Tax=Streptomyces hirsutus TaxID=35620 RepID=UPI003648DB21
MRESAADRARPQSPSAPAQPVRRRAAEPAEPVLGAPPSPQQAAALQRSLGNAAVTRMVQRARQQRADEHEHGPGCGHDTAPVQRSSPVHEVLRRPGKPLDDGVRTEMEARFGGADFSGVRLHTGRLARTSTTEVGARAFTSGRNVVIGSGGGDKHTLAHELGHYLQQQQGPVGGTVDDRGLAVSEPGDRWEVSAEKQARRVMSGPAPAQRAAESDAARQPAVPAPGAVAVQRMYSGDGEEEEYLGDDESGMAEALEDGDVLQQLIQDVRACTCEPRLQQEGRSTKEAVVRYPRNQKGERAEQTLRHISIRLFNCIRYLHDVALQNTQGDADGDAVMAESSSAPATKAGRDMKGKGKATPKKKGPPRESEVQGMLINGRLVFATNRNRSVTLLMEWLQAQSAGQSADAPALDLSHLMNREPSEKELRTGRPGKEADDVVGINRRAKLKIQQVYRGQRASSTAEAMQRKGPVFQLEAKPTSDEAVAELHRMLTSEKYKGAVILLKHSTGPKENPDGRESMHAEQKLMLALDTADLSEAERGAKIVVRGVKRPCKACWAMLEHYRQSGFPLGFNQGFGPFFQESSATIREHLPHVTQPPGGQGEGNWMSQQITAKAPDGTRVSAYSGERAPADAQTGLGGGKQTRVTAKEVTTKDSRIAYTHAEHGTGGHETVSDSDVIEESDGTLTSTFANLDLSGIRGVASEDSESEAVRRGQKRARKVNLDKHRDLQTKLDNAMGPEFKEALEERKRSGKTNASLRYPQGLLDMIVKLRDEDDVSMFSIARYLGVSSNALTETVGSRTPGLTGQADDGAAPSASKKKKLLGGPLDKVGKDRLLAALTPEFAAWRTAVQSGGPPGGRPEFGAALEAVIREMRGAYSAKAIGDFLGNVPNKTVQNTWNKRK